MKYRKYLAALLLATGAMALNACEHIEEPWTDKAPEFKKEHFDTNAPDAELRHRLKYTQIDR